MGAEDTFPVVGEIVKGGINSGDGVEKWDKLFGSQSPQGKEMTEYQRQKEFAQHGIRWRVEDAVRAGLNPEAVLGTSGASYSPQFSSGPVAPSYSDSDRAIDSFTAMGQNMFRSASATMTAEEKQFKSLQLQSLQQDIINKGIHNEILMKQYRDMNNGITFPSGENFVPGQTNSGLIKTSPMGKTASHPNRPAQEPGWSPDVGFARTDTGLVPVPSKDIKERIEDQMIPETMWAIRNYVMPNLGSGQPPLSMLPKGYNTWKWSIFKQEWQPAKNNKRPHYYNPFTGERRQGD